MKNALTWSDLADFYHKKTGQQARIKPMHMIFNWATRQEEIVEKNDSLYFKEQINEKAIVKGAIE